MAEFVDIARIPMKPNIAKVDSVYIVVKNIPAGLKQKQKNAART